MNKLNPNIKLNERNSITHEITKKTGDVRNKKSNKVPKNDQVSLSQTSKLKASSKENNIVSDVRYEVIKKYREVLNSGNYVVKADELADKIVQKIRENKNRMII